MARFIKVNCIEGTRGIVNADYIIEVDAHEEFTRLQLTKGHYVDVFDSLEDIQLKIDLSVERHGDITLKVIEE